MAIEVSRVKRFLEERRIDGEKESVLPSFGAICLLYFFSLCPPLPSLAPGCPSAPPASSFPSFSQGSSMECWRSSSQEH